ncbi:MAG: methylmalonyl-CoA mutase, large subunit [Thermoleophilia bacterium]|nr:methylmalonyl-CoA mutase, large subunit [Thermoleophilia bacterium]
MPIADRHISWTPRHRADSDGAASDAQGLWQAALARTPDRTALFTTMSGEEVPRLSTPESADIDYARDLGFPGQFPYTRGVYPSMYRGKPWTQRQFAGFGTAAETNERFHYLLSHGQHGLSVAFDMPSLMGYDSDDEMSLGEVGREGVAVDTVLDMERLFEGVPLDEVSTSMTINGPAPIILAFYAVMAEQRGIPLAKLSGTIQTDILKEYIAQKEWLFPPDPSMRLVTDMIEFCTKDMPRWHPVSISGYHIREAGSTAAQELAFTLANGFGYVEHAIARGLDVDAFAPRLSFFFNAHIDFFEEVAKLRAARRIWATVMRDKYGAKDPRSLLCRFHCQTAGVSLTWQQPLVNIARTAIEAMAAVMGGCQSLHTNSYDEAIALPTEEAVQIALRTQQVIAEETGVASTIDPLGGSYFVEEMTDRIEAQAYEYFARIEELGGVVEAVKQNFQMREIADASFAWQQEVEAGERRIVGVNAFQVQDEPEVAIHKIDPALEAQQAQRVRDARAGRDEEVAQRSLVALTEAARGDANLMYPLLDCARATCSEGEIVRALREVFGSWTETPVF